MSTLPTTDERKRSAMSQYLLQATNICKTYGGETRKSPAVEVLRDVSLNIQEKEFVLILGVSGCGKSTLLKILAGIESATAGNLAIDGRDQGRRVSREALRNFGYVFQNNNLLQWRTAEGNLRFVLEVMKLKGANWEKRVDEMLQIVGLQDYKNVYPHELSGGMRQRVGIARALVHDPKVLIFDQPLGALDAITRKMLSYELLNIWQKTQKTIVMVSNNVDEALLLANRIIVLSPLPGSIVREFKVDIPYEERTLAIKENSRYQELRGEINELIRSFGGAEK